MATGWQVGIDIGGTFTDVVAQHPASGEVLSAKVETRTEDRVAVVLAGLEAVGLEWSDADDLILGTTMVTNAIVEDDLASVALIATEGFSDTLAIGRQNRQHLYRLDLPPKIPPQVPAERRFEVKERVEHDGSIRKALDACSIEEVMERIAASGAEAVAISLLHSYAEPRHEEALGKRLGEKFPFVALSNRVNPEAREYERTATTVLSASVMPLTSGYLDRLERARPQGARLHLVHSAGGMASPEAVRDLPLALAMSGPAAGVAAAGRIARDLDIAEAISFDMGGTTTDVCLILDGEAQVASDRSVGGRPVRQPMVAVEAIGAGGGSIARLDHGALRVGPESAGADPGPACYGRGGDAATVSDADLVLGYLDPGAVLGGHLRLDGERARAAIAPLASAMEMTIEAAAFGIVRVANAAMVRALRRVTVERGIDGRRSVLIAYGGAGPMHAVEVARQFGIARVVVPARSSMFSALGCVGAEMSYSQQRTVRMAAGDWQPARLDDIRRSLRSRLAAPLLAAGCSDDDICLEEVASVRYRGQSYAIEIAAPAFGDPQALGKDFLATHEKLYGFATDEPWELVAIRQRASSPRSHEDGYSLPGPSRKPQPMRTAAATFAGEGAQATPRYDRAAVTAGQTIEGPAILEDAFSTVVVPPGATLAADAHAHLHIDTGVR